MNDIDIEKLYRHMAEQYAESYGAQLKQELVELETHGVLLASREFDEKLRKNIRTRKRRPALWVIAAACVLLLALLPGILKISEETSLTPDIGKEYEIIQLGFALPDGFTVKNIAQDIEKTVYYLIDGNLEGVVMTLEESSGPIPRNGLEEMRVGEKRAYGLVTEDYNILMLEDSGILYTMTNRRDIAPLLELGISI